MKPIHAMLALSVVQLLAFPLANAQVSARASLSNIGITLTDLAPDDGIAPSYTYVYEPATYDYARTSITYGPDRHHLSGGMTDDGHLPWGNHQLDYDSAAVPGHQGARMSATTRYSGTSLETLDMSAASSAQGFGSNWTESTVSAHINDMVLSPHTALRLTFDIDLLSTVDPKQSVLDNGWASSYFSIEFVRSLPTGNYLEMYVVRHLLAGLSVVGEAGLKTIVIDVTNTGDTYLNTYMRLNGSASSATPANPVPEPSSYAMLAAGLGVIGLLQRRSRRRSLAVTAGSRDA